MPTDLKRGAAALLLALAAATDAGAHITLSQPTAAPGAYYVGAFRVTHGCDGAPTTALRVEMPAGIVAARPQPKPGWTISIEHAPLVEPIHGEGGQLIRERVTAITWRGRLPEDEFDEFAISTKLPAGAGPIYFPAVQSCEGKEARWTDIPAAGQAWHSVPHPAPVLTLTPAAGDHDAMPGMTGMHHGG